MTTSLDGRAMFVTNLSDRSIYGINIADPDITPTAAMPFDTPVRTGQQLWAVTTYRTGSTSAMSTPGCAQGSPPRLPG